MLNNINYEAHRHNIPCRVGDYRLPLRAAPSWRLDDITKPLCTHLSRRLTYLWNTDNVVIVTFLSFHMQALQVLSIVHHPIRLFLYIPALSFILLHEYPL